MGKHVNRSRDVFWEPDEPPRAKQDNHYLKGSMAARPEHFDQPWPTIRSDTFVEMVFGAIQKNGRITQPRILIETGLDDDTVGTAIADLLIWKKQIGSEVRRVGDDEVREYFVRQEASNEA